MENITKKKNRVVTSSKLLKTPQVYLKEKKSSKVFLPISKGKIKAVSVLIVAKVLFQQSTKIEEEIFKGNKIMEIDIKDNSKEEIVEHINLLMEKIDEVLLSLPPEEVSLARKKAIAVLYSMTKHKNIGNAVSLPFLGSLLLFTYFIEGDGRKARDELFAFFKDSKNYYGTIDKYEETEMLDFISDQEICLDSLAVL